MKEITAEELFYKIDNDPTTFMLDVREHLEYCSYNIGGINIPLSELVDKICALPLKKEDEIIVVCAKGIRSKTACEVLGKLNFTNVCNLQGGLMEVHKFEMSRKANAV